VRTAQEARVFEELLATQGTEGAVAYGLGFVGTIFFAKAKNLGLLFYPLGLLGLLGLLFVLAVPPNCRGCRRPVMRADASLKECDRCARGEGLPLRP
jgi:hypothetical protein